MFNYPNFVLCSRKVFEKKTTEVVHWICNANLSSSSKPKNHYETLNLSKDCSSKEIREAFISLSKQCHPDKNKGNQKAQEQFVKVNEAYSVLIKPESRRDYDFALHLSSQPHSGYRSSEKNEFYEVHRQDFHYRDPWKDPSFARNRNFRQEDDNYYGLKGIQRQPHNTILFWIMVFAGCTIALQICFIRFSGLRGKEILNRRNEENWQHLDSVRMRASSYSSREEQINDMKRRISGNTKE